MDKNELENYIERLKSLEKNLSEDEDDDLSFISELDNILNQLSDDVHFNVAKVGYDVEVKIKKLHPNAVIPTYSKEGDAGMDLTITSLINETEDLITFGFGIAMEIPMGYVGLVFPRSSIRKLNLLLTNSVGVIDSGYRGEVQASFYKTKLDNSIRYTIGERGAQIIILPYPRVKMIESDYLSETDRGEGGFGSTGT